MNLPTTKISNFFFASFDFLKYSPDSNDMYMKKNAFDWVFKILAFIFGLKTVFNPDACCFGSYESGHKNRPRWNFWKKSKNRLYIYQIDNLVLEIENTHLKDVSETPSYLEKNLIEIWVFDFFKIWGSPITIGGHQKLNFRGSPITVGGHQKLDFRGSPKTPWGHQKKSVGSPIGSPKKHHDVLYYGFGSKHSIHNFP